MKLAFLSSLSFAVCCVTAGFAQPPTQSLVPPGTATVAKPQVPIDMEKALSYQIGPGDEITIKVVGEPDFDFAARVNEDGRIDVPFDEQPLDARCKTERQLRADMRKVLGKYLRNPQFNLRVTDENSRPPATIFGEVEKPQQVKLLRKARLIELLAVASGVKEEEAGGTIQVFRTQTPICTEDDHDAVWTAGTSDPTAVPSRIYSLAAVREGRETSNPVIYPGDVIVVEKAAPVYLTGEVTAPQGVYLKEGGLSLMDAIAKVSGVRDGAKTRDVKIYRLKKGAGGDVTSANISDRIVIRANLDEIKAGREKDPLLEAYDIIEVDKAGASIGKTLLEMAMGAGRTALSSVSNSAGYRILY